MTLGGLPPLDDVTFEQLPTSDAAMTRASANEIVTAFASLDMENDANNSQLDTARAADFQCRYRRGKCFHLRTLKKNGSMHSYCEYHRQLSVRNQRVFDHKKRRHQRKSSAIQDPTVTTRTSSPLVSGRTKQLQSP
ncbi:unnamed protein product [Hyaloperonospora brassicae]|uniref:SBP-type domain-containing protein n=1 Tax=Hyaloperonospora brassicae TaxID=162125 RepID=A0AAV0TRE3_HYABA|nr:unnamed protein product [Hyaloperonospora brassicae]